MPFANTDQRSPANVPTYQPNYCILDYTPHHTMAGVYHNERPPGTSLHASLLLNDHYGGCFKLKYFDQESSKPGEDLPPKGTWKRSRDSCKYVSFDPIPNIIPSLKLKGSKNSNGDAVYQRPEASR